MKWFWLIAIVFISSCRIERKIFSPLPVNNPSLQKKNDFSVNATISDPTGFDFNGGFAITDRLAIIAGAYTHKNKDIETHNGFTSHYDSSILTYQHKGLTLGAGVFFPLNRKKTDSYISFYSGINTGSFKMHEEFYQISPPTPGSPRFNNYKSRLNRYFIQGSFNYYSNLVELSLSSRYNLVEYKNVSTDYTNNQLSDYMLPPFVSHQLNSFLDFSFDVRIFFFRNTRLGIHLFGLASDRTNRNDELSTGKFYYYYPVRAGGGIIFRGFAGRNKGK